MTIISISRSSPSFVFYGKFNSLIFWSGSAGGGEGGLVEGGGGLLPHSVGTLYTTATVLLFCLFVFYFFNSPHQLYQLRDQSLVRMCSLVVTSSDKNIPWETLWCFLRGRLKVLLPFLVTNLHLIKFSQLEVS